jgi:spermidine synthase
VKRAREASRETGPGASKWLRRYALPLAAWAGASALAYEVLWFRVLTFFVDTSVRSFGIMLSAFLCGLAAGSALASRVVDSRADPLQVLAWVQGSVGLAGALSIPLIAHTSRLVSLLDEHVGSSWGAAAVARFLAFSLALLAPTTLMGATFPLLVKVCTTGSGPLAPRIGRVYALNTAGGVVGSLAAGFVLLPWIGAQKSIALVSAMNVCVGLSVLAASPAARRAKIAVSAGFVAALAAILATVPADAIAAIYSERYAAENHELLYLHESMSGTTAVIRETGKEGAGDRRYLLIDGRGEVSTDYFSMRAFRLLALLPAFYSAQASRALVVTFGSGIVAGSIGGLPDVQRADCVEICDEAFQAARYFAEENHHVLDNPKMHFVVDDGRDYLLTTRDEYDIISADATNPGSGDSWVLYTKEFYELAAGRLSASGVMSQWVPTHGMRESDFKTILQTFHAVFPYVSLYYSGGYKAAGHVVLLGSRSPLRIDVRRAERLFGDERVRADLADVNVLSLPDLFNCFLFDQTAIEAVAGGAPVNTDDRPLIAFSTSETAAVPRSWLASVAGFRQRVFPQLYGMDAEAASGIEQGLDASFQATTYAVEGQILEAEEYVSRIALDLDRPDEGTRQGLERSRSLLEQAIAKYGAALRTNPDDAHTRYLMVHAVGEMRALEGFAAHLRP